MSEPSSVEPRSTTEFESDAPPAPKFVCDQCGLDFEGSPGGAGLLLWTRGEEVRFEEPPLCEECAARVTLGAVAKWDKETEEEGG